jgi:hypothetical protein
MASVTITITDTPAKGVSFHSNFEPAVGAPLTLAQTVGLDMYVRASHQWGNRTHAPALPGVDIDAVHRSRDNVVAKV